MFNLINDITMNRSSLSETYESNLILHMYHFISLPKMIKKYDSLFVLHVNYQYSVVYM